VALLEEVFLSILHELHHPVIMLIVLIQRLLERPSHHNGRSPIKFGLSFHHSSLDFSRVWSHWKVMLLEIVNGLLINLSTNFISCWTWLLQRHLNVWCSLTKIPVAIIELALRAKTHSYWLVSNILEILGAWFFHLLIFVGQLPIFHMQKCAILSLD